MVSIPGYKDWIESTFLCDLQSHLESRNGKQIRQASPHSLANSLSAFHLSLNVTIPFYTQPGTLIKEEATELYKSLYKHFTIAYLLPTPPSAHPLGCGQHACHPIDIKCFPLGILCQIITTIWNTKVPCFMLKVASLPLTHIQ